MSKKKTTSKQRSDADQVLAQILPIIDVVRDATLEMTKEDREQQIQSILVEVSRLLQLATDLATPDRIEFSFLGATMRYPDKHEYVTEVDPNSQFYADHPKYLEMDLKRAAFNKENLLPTLIRDEVWESSHMCSDQWSSIFDSKTRGRDHE